MLKTLRHDRLHMLIRQKTIHRPAFPAAAHQMRVSEDLQLVRYRRLRHSQQLRDRTNTQLRLRQRIQDLHPRRVPENLEQIRQITQTLIRRQSASYLFQPLVMIMSQGFCPPITYLWPLIFACAYIYVRLYIKTCPSFCQGDGIVPLSIFMECHISQKNSFTIRRKLYIIEYRSLSYPAGLLPTGRVFFCNYRLFSCRFGGFSLPFDRVTTGVSRRACRDETLE